MPKLNKSTLERMVADIILDETELVDKNKCICFLVFKKKTKKD